MASHKSKSKKSKKWNPSPRLETRLDSNDDDEHLTNFWFSLPRTKHLRAEGINRLQQKKSNTYLNRSLCELIDIANHAEQAELDRLQSFEEQKKRRSALLDGTRFSDRTYTSEHPINEDLDDYLHAMPRSWASERKELEDDIKEKVFLRNEILKPKFHKKLRPIRFPEPKQSNSGFRERMLIHMDMIKDEALRQKVTAERKKELKGEIKDMEMFSRPMHFLKVPLMNKEDPLEGTDHVGKLYQSVIDKISQEALHTLRNPEPEFDISSTEEYETFEGPISSRHQSARLPTSAENNFNSPLGFERPESEPSVAGAYGLSNLDPNAESTFELECLREIVKFQEESGWNPKETVLLEPPSTVASGRKSNPEDEHDEDTETDSECD